MAEATSKTNPLHFEDLEPHRFEDLIRQLIYDFKPWTSLEATGQSGPGDGFDMCGRESIALDEGVTHGESNAGTQELLWLIHCKPDKRISTQKLSGYLDDILSNSQSEIHGVIFASSCAFSNKTRDVFRKKCRSYKVSECYLWGKAELEDILFQPKNDNLLFAYFGILLSIRKKTLKTQINSILNIKRKTIKCLGPIHHEHYKTVLLRDPNEKRYPYGDKIPDFDKHPTWKTYYFVRHCHDGLEFLSNKFFAYIADDGIHWDYVEEFNEARPPETYGQSLVSKADKKRDNAHSFWLRIPEKNRAWLEVRSVVLYNNIIAIDEDGDDIHYQSPQIYVPFKPVNGPFEPYCFPGLKPLQSLGHRVNPDKKNRIKFFPDDFPDAEPAEQTDKPDSVDNVEPG